MQILPGRKYLIQARYIGADSPDKGPEQFIGTIEQLRRAIATTWSKIPHQVYEKGTSMWLASPERTNHILARFEIEEVPLEIPEHF